LEGNGECAAAAARGKAVQGQGGKYEGPGRQIGLSAAGTVHHHDSTIHMQQYIVIMIIKPVTDYSFIDECVKLIHSTS